MKRRRELFDKREVEKISLIDIENNRLFGPENTIIRSKHMEFTEQDLVAMGWGNGYPDFVMCPNCKKATDMDCNDSESDVEEWTCNNCGKRWRILFSAIHIYEIEKEN